MKPSLHTSKRLALAIAVFCIGTAASCNMTNTGTVDFDFTGQVLDYDTKAPIEGAFVLAVYKKVDLGMAASAEYCVKTKGMVTGKDGKFNFPIERLDSVSPAQVFAIKADYYLIKREIPSLEIQRNNNKETYSNRHVYLKKQDPAKLDFRYGYGQCERPESREAVEANIQFLLLERQELSRLATGFDWYKNAIETSDSRIHQLQAVPAKR
jgi:hypothetical protein